MIHESFFPKYTDFRLPLQSKAEVTVDSAEHGEPEEAKKEGPDEEAEEEGVGEGKVSL